MPHIGHTVGQSKPVFGQIVDFVIQASFVIDTKYYKYRSSAIPLLTVFLFPFLAVTVSYS